MNQTPTTGYEAAKNGCAVGPVALGLLRFIGSDAAETLNGLLSNDVRSLAVGQGVHACLLTAEGKLVSHFFLVRRADDFLALCPPEALPPLKIALEKYLAVSDTRMEDLSAQWIALAVLGPRAAESLAQANLQGPIPVGDRLWGLPGFALLVEPAKTSETVHRLFDTGAALFSPDELEAWRVEGGVPRLGLDVDETVFPVEANLASAVHPNKGCYLGQEVIARLMNKGKPRRHLVRLKLLNPVPPGMPVFWEGADVGRLTSVARSPAFQAPLGLALLRSEAAKPGLIVDVRTPNGVVMAEVLGGEGEKSPVSLVK